MDLLVSSSPWWGLICSAVVTGHVMAAIMDMFNSSTKQAE